MRKTTTTYSLLLIFILPFVSQARQSPLFARCNFTRISISGQQRTITPKSDPQDVAAEIKGTRVKL